MGIISFLQSIRDGKSTKEKRLLYGDLLKMASIDGSFSDDETEVIKQIIRVKGNLTLGPDIDGLPITLKDVLKYDKNSLTYLTDEWETDKHQYPKNKEKKLQYLMMVVSVMLADGECTPEEINYCYQIADKMGLGKVAVYACMVYFKEGAEKRMDLKLMGAVLSYFENGGYKPNF